MRRLHDKHGIEVGVHQLEWRETYFGWMEGEPGYMNEVILNEMLPGLISRVGGFLPHLIINSDERRTLSEVFGVGPHKQQEKKYLPGEMAIAILTSSWCPNDECDESRLIVAWFQDPSDPFATLAEIVGNLDWKSHLNHSAEST